MIEKTDKIAGFDLPILISNLIIDQKPECKEFEKITYKKSGVSIKEYLIKNLTDQNNQNLLVGIIGLYGPNSAFLGSNNRHCVHFKGYNDSSSEDKWEEYVNTAYNLSMILRNEHNVDLIIALGHSGNPEDINLIKSLNSKSKLNGPVIDVHISSHTHEIYGHFIDGTYLFQNDNNGNELGILELEFISKASNPRIKIRNNKMVVQLNQYFGVDKKYYQVVENYKKIIDENFLKQLTYEYNSKIIYFEKPLYQDDYEFGRFLCSSILKQMNKENKKTSLITSAIDKVDIYLNSIACVRALPEFYQMNKTIYFHEIFRMLGIGHIDEFANEYNIPGDPIVHMYIHKSQLSTLITASRFYALMDMSGYFIYSDSLTFDWSWFGIPFVNMVTNMKINGKSYEEWPEYLHIAAPLIIADFIPKSKQLTYGLVNFKIFDKYGRVLNNLKNEHTYFKEYLLVTNYLKELQDNKK